MDIIYKTKFLELKSTPSPSGHPWYYVKRTNDSIAHDSAVVIMPIVKNDDEYNFLFIKTMRPPLNAENKAKYCLEFPAGLIGDIDNNETLLECAKKELLEEAGLRADKLFIELTNSSASSGLTSETLSFVSAIISEYKIIKEPISDAGIIIERFLVPIKNVTSFLEKLDKKEISVASATVCALFFAQNRIHRLGLLN